MVKRHLLRTFLALIISAVMILSQLPLSYFAYAVEEANGVQQEQLVDSSNPEPIGGERMFRNQK